MLDGAERAAQLEALREALRKIPLECATYTDTVLAAERVRLLRIQRTRVGGPNFLAVRALEAVDAELARRAAERVSALEALGGRRWGLTAALLEAWGL